MRVSRVPSTPCDHCGKVNDAVTPMGDYDPDPGSISLCGYCCGILIFDRNLRTRALTSREMEVLKTLPVWPAIEHARRSLREFLARRN